MGGNIMECPNVATLLWESVRIRLTLPKWGLGSPWRLLKLQSLITGVKTPRIGVFFISLENYQSVNVENGLVWAIWTFATQVMAKRKAKSQTGSLTPDHQKLRIDLTPMHAGWVWHTVEKILMKGCGCLACRNGGLFTCRQGWTTFDHGACLILLKRLHCHMVEDIETRGGEEPWLHLGIL